MSDSLQMLGSYGNHGALRAQKVAEKFTANFLNPFVQEMFASTTEESEDVFQELFAAELSMSLAKSDSMGFLVQAIKKQFLKGDKIPHAKVNNTYMAIQKKGQNVYTATA